MRGNSATGCCTISEFRNAPQNEKKPPSIEDGKKICCLKRGAEQIAVLQVQIAKSEKDREGRS